MCLYLFGFFRVSVLIQRAQLESATLNTKDAEEAVQALNKQLESIMLEQEANKLQISRMFTKPFT